MTRIDPHSTSVLGRGMIRSDYAGPRSCSRAPRIAAADAVVPVRRPSARAGASALTPAACGRRGPAGGAGGRRGGVWQEPARAGVRPPGGLRGRAGAVRSVRRRGAHPLPAHCGGTPPPGAGLGSRRAPAGSRRRRRRAHPPDPRSCRPGREPVRAGGGRSGHRAASASQRGGRAPGTHLPAPADAARARGRALVGHSHPPAVAPSLPGRG